MNSVQLSGTTMTFVIVEGSVIIVASVGDSRCILESAERDLYYLSADHRLECSEEDCLKVILDILEMLKKPDVNAMLHQFGFQVCSLN
ncbi:unnamed protein product [Lactuca saligna]|uniref:PPM-type phosphatase domain-containing protein n=1 Tax=Lactuca saligna TaxID=75948 RepID=A0AA35ZVG8_LACSI|nr:unnamed protein product [Lactuca saligna]